MTNTVLHQLKEERDFLVSELKVRVDPSHEIQNSPYNEYLADQIEEINTTIYEILTRNKYE